MVRTIATFYQVLGVDYSCHSFKHPNSWCTKLYLRNVSVYMAFFYPKTCSNCLFSSGWILLLVSAHAHSLVLKPPIRTASSGVKEKTRPHCLAKSHLPGRDLSPCHPLNLRMHGHPAGRVQIPVQRRPKGLVSQSLVLKVEKHLNRVQFWHLVWPCCARLNRPAKRMEEFPLEGKSFGKHWTCLLTPNHKLRRTCYSPTSQMRNRICSACWTLCVEQQRMKPPRPSLNPLYLLDPTPQTCPPSHLQYHWTPLHNHPSTCHKDTIVLLSQLTLLSQPTCLSQVPTIFQPPATHSLFSVRYLLWVWPQLEGRGQLDVFLHPPAIGALFQLSWTHLLLLL